MTDILLDTSGDILIKDGEFVIIDDKATLVMQRLLNKLQTLTGSWFTDINFGVDRNLLFKKRTQSLLDQHLRTLIQETVGVQEVVFLESEVGVDRVYRCNFQCKVDTGVILSVKNFSYGAVGDSSRMELGVWRNHHYEFAGRWDNLEIWGSK